MRFIAKLTGAYNSSRKEISPEVVGPPPARSGAAQSGAAQSGAARSGAAQSGSSGDTYHSKRRSPEERAKRRQAREINDAGKELADAGQHEAAANKFREAIALYPEDEHGHLYLGRALHKLKRPEEAIASLREAARLTPDEPKPYKGQGDVLQSEGRLTEAEPLFRRAEELMPACYSYPLALGQNLMRQGRLPEADTCFKRANALDPTQPIPLRNQGDVAHMRGEDDAAELLYRRAIEVAPKLAENYIELSYHQSRQARFTEAAASCDQALALQPTNATYAAYASRYRNLAAIYRECPQVGVQSAQEGLPARAKPKLSSDAMQPGLAAIFELVRRDVAAAARRSEAAKNAEATQAASPEPEPVKLEQAAPKQTKPAEKKTEPAPAPKQAKPAEKKTEPAKPALPKPDTAKPAEKKTEPAKPARTPNTAKPAEKRPEPIQAALTAPAAAKKPEPTQAAVTVPELPKAFNAPQPAAALQRANSMPAPRPAVRDLPKAAPQAVPTPPLFDYDPVAWEASLRQELRKGPPSAETYLLLGRALLEQGRRTAACKQFIDATEMHRARPQQGLDPALVDEAKILSRYTGAESRPADTASLDAMRAKLQADPSNGVLRASLARCLLYDPKPPIRDVRESLQLMPDNLQGLHRAVQALHARLQRRGDLTAAQREQFGSEHVARFEQCLKKVAAIPCDQVQRVLYLISLSKATTTGSQGDQVAELLKESTDSLADAPQAHREAARLYLLAGDAYNQLEGTTQDGAWIAVDALLAIGRNTHDATINVYRDLPWGRGKPSLLQLEHVRKWSALEKTVNSQRAYARLLTRLAIANQGAKGHADELATAWAYVCENWPYEASLGPAEAERLLAVPEADRASAEARLRCALVYQRNAKNIERLSHFLIDSYSSTDREEARALSKEGAKLDTEDHLRSVVGVPPEAVAKAQERLRGLRDAARAAYERQSYNKANDIAKAGIQEASSYGPELFQAVRNDVAWLWHERGIACKQRAFTSNDHTLWALNNAIALAVDRESKGKFKVAYLEAKPLTCGPMLGR